MSNLIKVSQEVSMFLSRISSTVFTKTNIRASAAVVFGSVSFEVNPSEFNHFIFQVFWVREV